MNDIFLPYALPDVGDAEVAAVGEVIRSGWVTTGPKTKEFEKLFSDFLGDGIESIAVNSATSGLHLALEALGIGPGDEVITTTMTFTATAEVVRYLGADPVFIDMNFSSMNIDPKGIEAAITSRTKAIIPVHYGGLSCDMDAILKIAKRHNLKVIEDAAHSLPTTYKGKKIGTLGSDVTVFSFYANKTMTTGEGGMVVVRDKKLAQHIKMMRLHGINRDAFDRYVSKSPSWFYEVVAPGFKYNLTDIASAMGIVQLGRLNGFQKRREEIASIYFKELAGMPVILPEKPLSGDVHSWHIFPLRLKGEVKQSRDQIIEQMSAAGIGTSVHYIPLHLQPYWKDRYKLDMNNYPNAQSSYERMFSIPLYTKMTNECIVRVVKALDRIFNR